MRIAFIQNGKYDIWYYDNFDEGYDFLAELAATENVNIISVTDMRGFPIKNWKEKI